MRERGGEALVAIVIYFLLLFQFPSPAGLTVPCKVSSLLSLQVTLSLFFPIQLDSQQNPNQMT